MDTPASDYLRHCLQRYEQSIDDIARHYIKPDSFGPCAASAPYQERCAIRSLLAAYDPGEPGYAGLRQEYLRITERLAAFGRERGPEYRALLFSDLRQYVHAYHAAACYAHLGGMTPGAARDLSRRALIGELYRELDGDYDLAGIRALIAHTDESLTGTGWEDAGQAPALPLFELPVSDRSGDGEDCGYRQKPAGRAGPE
jgi:hypothetical protein